jgi:uncharacterized protein YdeI (YjbR/CyaY-like superfamily)
MGYAMVDATIIKVRRHSEAMIYLAAADINSRGIPQAIADAQDADPGLAEAFHRLTPGRQKSYVINLNSAKTPQTRMSRIAKFLICAPKAQASPGNR